MRTQLYWPFEQIMPYKFLDKFRMQINTLLIRFFWLNLSESTSSFDWQSLILPFITSNYKTDINMSCILLSLFSSSKKPAALRTFRNHLQRMSNTYFVEDNKTNMHRKSRKYNCIRYVEMKYGSLLEERVSKEKPSCEGNDNELC